MNKINNYEDDDIYLSSNGNYNAILTEEDLKKIIDPNLKEKALIIHEEILWLKYYKYVEKNLK